MLRRWVGLGCCCVVLALGVGCKRKVTGNAAPVTAKNGPGPVKGGVLDMLDELSDDTGDDGDRAPAAKQTSARADAQMTAAARAKLTQQDLVDPTLAAQHVGPPKVTVKKDAKGGCGEITVAGHKFRLDCDTPDYAKVRNASQSLMSEDEIGGASPSSANLPAAVDFREKKQVGPMLDQGNTLSCTAVSLAAVVNHELALKGRPGDVSSMHIWGRYANPSMDQAIQTNEGKNIAPMSVLPFDAKLADQWDRASPPSASFIQQYDSKSVVKIVDVMQVAPKDIRGTLAQGHAVWFALAAAHYIQKTDGKPGGPQTIPAYDYRTAPPQHSMGHALALMGYTTKNGKPFYLVQNSWGADWGDKGFAYIDEDTLFRNLRSAYTIEVSPTGKVEPPAPPPTKCKTGLLPDATTGKCAAACPDGSARNDNVCAESGECDRGEVNVRGQCVRAAPTLSVKKENYAIKCVPGGCMYGFARGTAGCTRASGCVVSCPAPNFKLARAGNTIRCH